MTAKDIAMRVPTIPPKAPGVIDELFASALKMRTVGLDEASARALLADIDAQYEAFEAKRDSDKDR